jgi:L-seryl-tRNA(Ser) seleniumtransferase
MQDPVQNPGQALPSVDSLARTLDDSIPHLIKVEIARVAIDQARADGSDAAANAEPIAQSWQRRRPTRVLNATGVLLHTNLGRAPLHPTAAEAAAVVSQGYSNTEFKLSDGTRGDRAGYVHDLLARLTGAEDALVVNNNAGALYLTLAALTQGREVPVSRGELIEIGGSYRLPELMAATGTVLIEVGTTNKTHLKDYDAAIDSDTAAILKVHPSNYRTEGFVADVSYTALAELANKRGLHFLADVGSGLLDETAPWLPKGAPAWLQDEPGVKQALAAGANLVLFSGDKLLGGPQAGVIVGDKKLISRLRAHPAARALRCSAAALAALSGTLDFYADGKAAELPLWSMAMASADELATRLEDLGVGEIVSDASVAGGGTLPGIEIKGPVLRIPGPGTDRRWQRLLASDPPIVARRSEGDLLIDLRTVDPGDDHLVSSALSEADA